MSMLKSFRKYIKHLFISIDGICSFIHSTNDHLWRSKFYIISQSIVSKNWKKLGRWGRQKKHKSQLTERGAERDDTILFNSLWVFDVFMLLPAIIMQYLYDSVNMPWKFGFPLKVTEKLKMSREFNITK